MSLAVGELFSSQSHADTSKRSTLLVFLASLFKPCKGPPTLSKSDMQPDGYFINKDNLITLLEFKCPFKRKIAMYRIPHHYSQQVQAGLAFSSGHVNKAVFVDTYFRICTLNQLEPSLKHNKWLNGGNIYETKANSVLAWGVCYLYSKHNLIPNQTKIIDIADGQTSTFFKNIMSSISDRSIWFFMAL